MIYSLLYPLHTTYSAFNVLRYISFRTVVAALTAFLISFMFGPWLIRKLTANQIGQQIRPDGPERHLLSTERRRSHRTPDMGEWRTAVEHAGAGAPHSTRDSRRLAPQAFPRVPDRRSWRIPHLRSVARRVRARSASADWSG